MTESACAAVLIGEKTIEIRPFPIPELQEDEILVEVEGCGICGTDVHEYKRDPFGLIPVVLGHEGTGRIVEKGSQVATDFTGQSLSVGDSIVTSVMVPEDGFVTQFPAKKNLSDQMSVYGLIPDSEEYHLNGYFASHIVLRKGATVFKVNGMSMKQRILIEPMAVTNHALERIKSVNLIDFSSVVLVQGCGPIGLMMIATLMANGVANIIAVDSVPRRLDMARKLGATQVLNIAESSLADRINQIQEWTGARGGVDFAVQCIGVPAAAADIWKYVRRGGGLCEVGFFMDNGTCCINPHEDICKKEITVVGSWVYTPEEYPAAIGLIRQCERIGLPLEDLVTSTYPLEEINKAMEDNIEMRGIKLAIVPPASV